MKIILRTINGDVKVVYDSEVKPAEGENITVGEGEATAIYKVLGVVHNVSSKPIFRGLELIVNKIQ